MSITDLPCEEETNLKRISGIFLKGGEILGGILGDEHCGYRCVSFLAYSSPTILTLFDGPASANLVVL